MSFTLTQELIDNLIFAMENQHKKFVVDTQSLEILPAEAAVESVRKDGAEDHAQGGDEFGSQPKPQEDDSKQTGRPVDTPAPPVHERYVTIPEWSSADGYHLMEKFVSTLHNPIFRQNLRNALASGKGVFRNFKNTLKSREEMERKWYAFKEREMRRRILEWYERLCDAWEVEAIGPEPPETEELLLTDFIIKEGRGSFGEVMDRCDYNAFRENLENASPVFIAYVYHDEREGWTPSSDDAPASIFRAETPAGEFAGFIWGKDRTIHLTEEYAHSDTPPPKEDAAEGADHDADRETIVSRILQLYVVPEYRGLGLSKIILDRYVRESWERGIDRIVLSLFGHAIDLSDKFIQRGYKPLSQLYDLDLEEWAKSNNLIG